MFTLSRRVNEEIVIVIGDSHVRIGVVGIDPATVRLGIEAPPSMSVHRREVFDATRQRPDESTRGIAHG